MTQTKDLFRRKRVGRIGFWAAADYSAPSLTTISLAYTGSAPSGDIALSVGPSNLGAKDASGMHEGI